LKRHQQRENLDTEAAIGGLQCTAWQGIMLQCVAN
jgi:hypothetical protein